MEIHHLKQFIVISQCGSINSASQKLYISQPSLNNTVKRCEQELGFTVFLRTPKGIKLTEKGTQFIESAQKIITESILIVTICSAGFHFSINVKSSKTILFFPVSLLF